MAEEIAKRLSSEFKEIWVDNEIAYLTIHLLGKKILIYNDDEGIIASNAYEMEEFVHGPSYEISKDHAVFLIDGGDEAHERMAQLYDALTLLTDKVYMITNNRYSKGRKIWKLDHKLSNDFNILLNIIPFQLIAESICNDLDLLSYNVRNYDFEKKIKTKA